MYTYDIAIIGSGPSGLFAALELSEKNPSLKIILLEAGPHRTRSESENPNSGFGGAGAFSDGKLTFEPSIGGSLTDFLKIADFERLALEVEQIWMSYLREGALSTVYGGTSPETAALVKDAFAEGMKLIPYRVRHFGTDQA